MAEFTRWKPASDHAVVKRQPDLLPTISEPPCRSCKHFAPRRTFNADDTFAGVRLCHADRMEFDFGCFEAKP